VRVPVISKCAGARRSGVAGPHNWPQPTQFVGAPRGDVAHPHICQRLSSARTMGWAEGWQTRPMADCAIEGLSAEATAGAVDAWLAAHPRPTSRQLAEAGLVAPHWPQPWGVNATPAQQIAIDEVLKRHRVSRPQNAIGIGWAGPTIVAAGTDAQRDRYLWPLLAAEEIWCQLFSEPDAGSDLASLNTRAVRDGDEWIVNGTKVWTSSAHHSTFGILLARTGESGGRQQGVTYFICPMDAPGVQVRPLVDMTGAHTFNQVTMTDVRLSDAHVVGEVHHGWRLAKLTLANERVSLSSGGLLWGHGPTTDDLLTVARSMSLDAVQRDRWTQVAIQGRVLDLLRARGTAARIAGREPGPETSLAKMGTDPHAQEAFATLVHSQGASAMRAGDAGLSGFLFTPALTIGGGTSEVQRTIIGERVLGLAKEPDATKRVGGDSP
jgi:3-oxochol-4-en-24-oyl-CoA dehydrogenase